MANKGLKSYTKQVSQGIGNVAQGCVNVNKADANLHIVIPLFTTLGPNPIELSLIYNYQDRNVKREFGKGCNMSTFKDIRTYSNRIEIYEADGSFVTYQEDSDGYYYSKENPLKVVKEVVYLPGDGDYDTFSIYDKMGNKIYYDENSIFYPATIEYVNGFKITFDWANMDNNQGATVTFTETSNNMYSRATYQQNGTTLYYVDFGYDTNQRLTSVKHYKESSLVKHLSITYSDTEIKVKDEISKDYVIYTFVSNRVEKIEEVVNDNTNSVITTSIQYEDRISTITDNDNKKVYLYFDNNNLPLYEFDEEGNAVETEYDNTTKKLIRESSVIPTKNKLSTIVNPQITMFSKTSGIHTAPSSLSDPILSSILTPIYYVSGTGSLTYNYYMKGLGGDRLTAVIWLKQLTRYSTTSNVTVSLTAGEVVTDTFKKTTTDNQFDMMVLGLTAVKSYSKIMLTITLKGDPSFEIGGMQILKKDYGANYEYDNDGNRVGTEGGMGSTSSVYDSKGLRTQSVGRDSRYSQYLYDTKGNLVQVINAFGQNVINTYDSNTNNITTSIVSNYNNTKRLATSYAYDSNGRYITSQTDELGNTTNYTYDSFGRIKKVTDALNAITEYSYNAYDNLTKILFNNSDSASYTYDTQNKLTTVTLSNGTSYSFEYDANNNLNKVSMNGKLIVTYTYDTKTGLITNQKYGDSGDTYTFTYNEKHNIETVRGSGRSSYTYQYDQHDRLVRIVNYCGVELHTYTYNNDGQVTKTKSNGCEIEYSYNSLGEISQTKRTLNSKSLYQSYDSVSRSKGFSPDNLIGYLQGNEDFVGTLFNQSGALKNPSVGPIYPYNYKTYGQTAITYTRLGRVPCVNCDNTNTISYNPPTTEGSENSGCIAFWLYPTRDPSSNRYLFYTKSDQVNGSVAVYQNTSSYLVLELVDTSNNKSTYMTTTKLQINQWNFFCLNFSCQFDEQANRKIFSYRLYLNKDLLKDDIEKTIITDGGRYHIGYRLNGSNTDDYLDCKITALMIGCRKELSGEQIDQYYKISKDYLTEVGYLDGNSVNFSETTLHNVSQTMLNQFEIYPLQNGVASLTGEKPTAFDIRRVSQTDKDRTFNYNHQIKRFAYVADEGRLEYTLNMTTSGTVIMRAYSKEEKVKQYFFQMKGKGGQKIGIYKDINDNVAINSNGTIRHTDLNFSNNTWHTIGLSYQVSSASITLRVYLDGTTQTISLSGIDFQASALSVGRLLESETYYDDYNNPHYSYFPLLGQIEMLATRGAYCEVSTLNTLANELKDSTKALEYDDLGMLQKEVIKEGDTTIYTDEYSYKKRSSYSTYISKIIEKEKIKFGSTTVERSYGSDALGNVTSITDSTFGNHTYTYNARGFLTKEDSTEYNYDSNGNITKAGSTTFSYDSTIKDRLISVNGKQITYGSNPLNPASYNGNTYTFEGRRLVEIEKNNDTSYETISYEYDQQGLRTSKTICSGSDDSDEVYSENYKYYYDGDKLITEIGRNGRLDFLYDENGKLYGFIKDSTDKYYYIRDFMQNILGIIDDSGNLMVKYSYDAYGNLKRYTDSSGIGLAAFNPFRYKGYYYDSETNMYYCKSRYYVPQWCRWLNGDSVEYLDPTNINGMNVFSYSDNNPIGITYSGFSVGRSTSGRMASSIVGNLVNNPTIKGGFGKANRIKTNSVLMTNKVIFTLIKDPTMAKAFGNITYGVTLQHNSPETFYSFSNVGKDGSSVGFGANFGNWYGCSAYLSSDIGFGSSWQLTPWLTGSSGWSLENGISFSAGIINGNTTHEVTISVGNGVLAGYAACAIIAATIPGAAPVAAVTAGIIFLVDIFK